MQWLMAVLVGILDTQVLILLYLFLKLFSLSSEFGNFFVAIVRSTAYKLINFSAVTRKQDGLGNGYCLGLGCFFFIGRREEGLLMVTV